MKIQGIIFDFNGVLIDDEPLHFQSFRKTIQEEGLDLNWEEYCEKYLPYDDHSLFYQFLKDRNQQKSPKEIETLIQIKSRYYFGAIEQHIPIIRSSVAFVNAVPSTVGLAIASGATRQEIEPILDQLNLRQRFSSIITAADTTHSKPHPEAFLKALEELQQSNPNLERDETIVIEDSYRGVASAHQANLKCVALSTTYSSSKLSEANLVLETLEGWSLEQLADRLS